MPVAQRVSDGEPVTTLPIATGTEAARLRRRVDPPAAA